MIGHFRSELNRQKQRVQELEIQMETDHQKMLEVWTVLADWFLQRKMLYDE